VTLDAFLFIDFTQKDLQCSRRLCSYKYAIPSRQQMADKICDGMGFSGTGRSLHQYTARRSNFIHNAALFIVRWFGEKDLSIKAIVWGFVAIARFAIVLGTTFRKVCEFTGNVLAVFNLLLDPF